jgi:hypothetical protein
LLLQETKGSTHHLTASCPYHLSFQYLPKLELLNVTDCRNIYDVDFQVISKCMQLEQLYLSFNEISVFHVQSKRLRGGLVFLVTMV